MLSEYAPDDGRLPRLAARAASRQGSGSAGTTGKRRAVLAAQLEGVAPACRYWRAPDSAIGIGGAALSERAAGEVPVGWAFRRSRRDRRRAQGRGRPMCGICGIVNFHGDDAQMPGVLEAMTGQMAHRGP